MADPYHISDFTAIEYEKLLVRAKTHFTFTSYRDIPENGRFVLWRHDCDFSMNRALRFAEIENRLGCRCTYFLRPRSEAYNLLEAGQSEIVRKIIDLGHDIGLHLDTASYDIQTEGQLDSIVRREASWLEDWFGTPPIAMSFHTPTKFELSCDSSEYGGLVNCYSKYFKEKVSYCSDSNGYWRFLRLHDVLHGDHAGPLQVLTHPELWQEKPMPPRRRIFRCFYGRAEASLKAYDNILVEYGRKNVAGAADSLQAIKRLDNASFVLCDYLWNKGRLETLFMELWRIHESQIVDWVRNFFIYEWHAPVDEVDDFLTRLPPSIDSGMLFESVSGSSPYRLAGLSEQMYTEWLLVRQNTAAGRGHVHRLNFEDGCVDLCGFVQSFSDWVEVRGAEQHQKNAAIGVENEMANSRSGAADEENWSEYLREMGRGKHPPVRDK